MIAKGGSSASKIYLGSTEVSKIYKGDTLVYGGTSPVLPYDAQIEYLESDGDAYISTGIAPADISPIMEVTIYLPSVSSAYYPVGSDGSGNTRFSIGRLTSNRIEFRIGTYKNVGSKGANWYDIKLDGTNGQASLNGVVQWTSTTSPLVFNTMPITIFGRASATAPVGLRLEGSRVSSFKLWNGDTLLQDLIPVRIGQVGYFYNKVDGTFFGNASESGAFVLGADVSS